MTLDDFIIKLAKNLPFKNIKIPTITEIIP